MEKEYCANKGTLNCLACKDAVLVEPKGFKTMQEVIDVFGLWDAFCVAEVVCPHKEERN